MLKDVFYSIMCGIKIIGNNLNMLIQEIIKISIGLFR